jgi:hypothetical protein
LTLVISYNTILRKTSNDLQTTSNLLIPDIRITCFSFFTFVEVAT